MHSYVHNAILVSPFYIVNNLEYTKIKYFYKRLKDSTPAGQARPGATGACWKKRLCCASISLQPQVSPIAPRLASPSVNITTKSY